MNQSATKTAKNFNNIAKEKRKTLLLSSDLVIARGKNFVELLCGLLILWCLFSIKGCVGHVSKFVQGLNYTYEVNHDGANKIGHFKGSTQECEVTDAAED